MVELNDEGENVRIEGSERTFTIVLTECSKVKCPKVGSGQRCSNEIIE